MFESYDIPAALRRLTGRQTSADRFRAMVRRSTRSIGRPTRRAADAIRGSSRRLTHSTRGLARRGEFDWLRHGNARWWVLGGAAAAGAYFAIQKLREANLENQVVLITGGSRGLGLLLAREFGRCGCRVAICARDTDELERARRLLERDGVEASTWRCDVSDRDEMEELIEEVTRYHGRIDVLVNNAGMIQVGPLESLAEEDFAEALDVMFWAPLRATLAVLPQMKRRGYGRIVNITSIGGMVSMPHMLPYNCAKFAAVGMSQGLHAELSRLGIRVTTVVPGLMRVGSQVNALFRGQADKEFAWFALGASLPPFSMRAERAARKIVKAVRRGDAMRIVGLPANVLERLHGLMPGTTAHALSLVNRVLPAYVQDAANGELRGREIQERMHSHLLDALISPGTRAAHRFNEL